LLEQLELLLQLQDIDIELAELEGEHAMLPRELAALEDERVRACEDVETRAQVLEEAKKARARRERDLEDANAKINDLRSKQVVIKTNAEYAALTHEIEFMKQEISDIEEDVLGLLEEIEEKSKELEAIEASAEQSSRDVDSSVAELKTKLSELDDAIAVKKDERLRIAMRVDGVLLARYERLFASKGDCAIACITDGACSGCYKSLPPQTVLEVKRAGRMIECDGCGRILYWSLETDSG
jgi:predicted  nucleic acid-binding Zn-ribbon protein